jgi:hypothetical protein
MSGEDLTYVPFRAAQGEQAEAMARPTGSRTAPSIALAVLPLGAFGIDLTLFSADRQSVSWTTLAIVAIIAQFVGCLLAAYDQRRLQQLGLTQPTSALIAVVCPTLYLLVRGNRAHRETYTGLGPVWLNVAALVAVVIAFLTLPITLSTMDTLNSIANTGN